MTLDGLGGGGAGDRGGGNAPARAVVDGPGWVCTSPQDDLTLLVSASCRASLPPRRGVQVTTDTAPWPLKCL